MTNETTVDLMETLIGTPFEKILENPSDYVKSVNAVIESGTKLPDSFLAGVPGILNAVSEEVGGDLSEEERTLLKNECGYLLEHAMIRFVDKESLIAFEGSESLRALFKSTVEFLCRNYISSYDGKTAIPDYREVASNLLTYSFSAVQRLGVNPSYLADFQSVPEVPVLVNGQTYLVILSCGVVLDGKYDNLDESMVLHLADSEVRIKPNRLLAIHKTINDTDFLRGIPRITYEGLSNVKCGYLFLEPAPPVVVIKTSKKPTKTKKQKQRISGRAQSKARRHNRK